MADPIHQFQLNKILDIKVGPLDLSMTNSSAYMILTIGVIAAFLFLATKSRSLVPSRWQSAAEMTHEFVADTLRQSTGNDGMRFFPFVFSLFMFVLVANLIGLIPYTFTVTSHIIVTFALAMLVIGTVIVYGFMTHGLHFLNLFVPSGMSPLMLLILVPIEIISFLSRPISLSVRLFANMLAGHIALKIFAGFVATLLGAGLWAVLSPLPLFLTIALTALEVLVAVLQAYVFATLTCIYLADALHPGH